MRNLKEIEIMAKSAFQPYKIFGVGKSKEYAQSICDHLGMELSLCEERVFEDGEFYIKAGDGADGNVRGHQVFVVHSLYGDDTESVNDKLMKLCIFCGSLKDASAYEVVAVIPYLAYSRQDRKTSSRAPITTKYVAKMLEGTGVDRALVFDIHNLSACQNSFQIPIDNLEAKNLIADWCARRLIDTMKTKKVRVLSPDSGGLGRCERFRLSLLKRLNKMGANLDDIEIVVFDKLRIEGEVRGGRIIGDVEDADVIAYDDMISTGSTMQKACVAVAKQKGRMFAICATHGFFCGNANDVFEKVNCQIVTTDTVDPFRLNEENSKKLHVISTTKMVADAISRIHSGNGSISQLLS